VLVDYPPGKLGDRLLPANGESAHFGEQLGGLKRDLGVVEGAMHVVKLHQVQAGALQQVVRLQHRKRPVFRV